MTDTPLRVGKRPAVTVAPQPAVRDEISVARIRPNGGVRVRGINFQIDGQLAGQTIYVVPETDALVWIPQQTRRPARRT